LQQQAFEGEDVYTKKPSVGGRKMKGKGKKGEE
jgi:hypothetical protein